MKNLSLLVFAFFPLFLLGQTQTENYTKTTTYKKASTLTTINVLNPSDASISINYFDGLNRLVQKVENQQSPTGKDIVTLIGYDIYGREEKNYLPYVPTETASLNYKSNAFSEVNTFYNTAKYENTLNPYSQKEYDFSPLNRISRESSPGNDWKMNSGHEIKLDYQSNTNVDQVRHFKVSFTSGNKENPKLQNETIYTTAQLYKTITKNENWQSNQANINENTIQQFTDNEGRLILKRTFATVENGVSIEKYDTYYVYDDYGNLTFIIPPKAADLIGNTSANTQENETSKAVINSSDPALHLTATNSIVLLNGFNAQAGSTFSAVIVSDAKNILNNLCYQYIYDSRDRLVEKKLPGKDWEYIIYDDLDRQILTQDGNLRKSNKWLFTKYDALGRPVFTGEYTNTSNVSRSSVQLLADASTVIFENKQASVLNINGTNVNYSNNAFPTSGIDLFTINYYDNYNNFNLDGASSVSSYGLTPITNTKGLHTCTKIRTLETNSWSTSVAYFDDKSRPIYNYTKNAFLDVVSTVKTQYNFTGEVLETTSTHQKGVNGIITIIDTFTYDTEGRILTQKQQINSQTPEIIVANTYDSLGKLISKGVGGKSSNSNRLQTIDYTYNIRGWLKGINDSNSSNASITMGISDLFGFKINYNNPSTGTALYNGNITQTFWKTVNTDSNLKNYNYTYDALNRLQNATDNLGKFTESVRYDKNGNITYLKRLGEVVNGNPVPLITNPTDFGVMDDLTYTYDIGNKLMKVSDAAPINGFGFKDDVVNSPIDNQDDYSYDVNGNMTTDTNKGIIDIKYNQFNLPIKITFNSGIIEYKYDAEGNKLQKKANNITTDYASDFIYENNVLKFLSQPEGYIVNNSGNYNYIYQYKDHLGNIRLTYGDRNNDGIITVSSDPTVMEIIEENNYYPLGLTHKGYNYLTIIAQGNATAQKNKYNGNEEQTELGLNMYDLGARMYMPDLGRFSVLDPMTDFITHQSPFAFSNNNPITNIDEYGLGIFNVIGNLFQRLFSAIASIGNECSCNTRTQESVGAAFRRADFPKLNEKINDIIGYRVKSKPKVRGVGPLNPRSFVKNDDDDIKSDVSIRNRHSNPEPEKPDPKPHKRPQVSFNKDVQFGNSSSKLNIPHTEKILKDLIKTLVDYPHLIVSISANVSVLTDQKINRNTVMRVDGKDGTVGSLQSARAKAIEKFLIRRGVNPKQILTKSGIIKTDGSNPDATFKLINPDK